MSDFITNCINGDAMMDEVNDFIDQWHAGEYDLSLHEFLGMTKKEYELFVVDENYLGWIVNAHKFGKNIDSMVREELAIAARSDDAAKAKKLQQWLESEGLWD